MRAGRKKGLATRGLALAWLGLLLLPCLMGMGLSPEESENPTRIPQPEVNYKVRLTDSSGLTIPLISFGIDGRPYLIGRLGAGKAAVPFSKIVRALFAKGDKGMVARVRMKGGATLDLQVDGKVFATGVAGYGNYKVRLDEVRSISFLGRVD